MSNFNRSRNDRDSNRNRGGGGRGFRSGGGFGGRNERPQMHDAVCDNCGNDCQVPFRPTGDRPVLCSNCFDKSRRSGSDDRGNRDFGGRDKKRSFKHESPMPTVAGHSSQKFDEILAKLDKIITLLQRTTPIKEVTVMKNTEEPGEPIKEEKSKKAAAKKKTKAKPRKK